MQNIRNIIRPHIEPTFYNHIVPRRWLHQVASIGTSDTVLNADQTSNIPRFSLSYKYNKFVQFRQKADSRINFLRMIIPEEYQVSNTILFNCVYFDPCNIIQTQHKDQFHDPVFLEQSKVLLLGKMALNHELEKFVLWLLGRKNQAELEKNGNFSLDMLSEVPRMVKTINNTAVRRKFISQFLNVYENKKLLDEDTETTTSIKIPEDIRHKVIPALLGFMILQIDSEKFSEFVLEFLIRGRDSKKKKYKHKGLYELSKRYRRHS